MILNGAQRRRVCEKDGLGCKDGEIEMKTKRCQLEREMRLRVLDMHTLCIKWSKFI